MNVKAEKKTHTHRKIGRKNRLRMRKEGKKTIKTAILKLIEYFQRSALDIQFASLYSDMVSETFALIATKQKPVFGFLSHT